MKEKAQEVAQQRTKELLEQAENVKSIKVECESTREECESIREECE